jgi:hypothetical protein
MINSVKESNVSLSLRKGCPVTKSSTENQRWLGEDKGVDQYSPKLANSGYPLAQIRRTMIGGLSGYEKRLRQSKLEKGKGWRALHESAGASCGARYKKKLMGKGTWFKFSSI